MSHARRYHEPGVGSRTGMRVDDGALDLDDFLRAGRKALIGSPRRSIVSRSSVSSSASNAKSARASSSMVIEQSPAPSPRSTLRQSLPYELTSSEGGGAFDKTQDSLSRGGKRSASTGLQDSHRRAALSALDPNTSEASGPSSPSPWMADSQVARRGLNAGLEARRQARLKLSSQLRYSSSIHSDARSASRPSDSRHSTASITHSRISVRADERQSQAELDASAAENLEREASISQASWPDVEDLPVDEGEIEVHDGSEMYSGGSDVNERREDVEADETDEGESVQDEIHEPDDMDEDGEETQGAVEASYEQDQVTAEDSASSRSSTIDAEEQFAPDSPLQDSHEIPLSTYASSEADSESIPGDAESNEGSETYSQEVTDDADIDPDITPVASITSFAQQSMIDDRDSSVSARRSILSERSSNVPRSSKGGIGQEKRTKTSKKRSKNDDMQELVMSKRKPSQQMIDGAVVERVPSSYHRNGYGTNTAEGEDGIRRGTRYRYRPLEYWRGERARYGRPSLPKSRERNVEERGDGPGGSIGDDTIDADAFEDQVVAAPPPAVVLKEIIRIPRAEGEGTFSGLKIPTKRSNGEKGSSTKRSTRAQGALDPTKPTRNPEDGWDKDTQTHAVVFDAANDVEAERQIACTSEQLRPRMAAGCTFGFEKVFVVEDFMATGVLFLLIDGLKPMKNSKDNYYTFVVLEGCVRVRVHATEFIVAPQGMFFVPRGNDYSIANIGKRVARLAFTQAKRPQSETAMPSSE